MRRYRNKQINLKLSSHEALQLAGLALIIFLSWLVFVGSANINSNLSMNKIDPDVGYSDDMESRSPVEVNQSLLVWGDVFFGRQVESDALSTSLKYAHPFAKLDTFELEKYDGVLANLECPVTENNTSFMVQSKQLKFNCKPEFLSEARKYFDAFSLSNNHTDNQDGEVGLKETRGWLEKFGFQYFGHYDNRVTQDTCEVITLPATLVFDDGDSEEVQLPMAWCGFHAVFRVPSDAEIAVMEQYSRYMPTFAMPHAGAEYRPTHDLLRQKLYRTMIDHGADAVYGGHPHWVQDIELYKDKMIAYSLGNFIFDQEFESDVRQGLGVVTHISVEYSDDVAALIDIAEICKVHKDNCLSLAKERNINKPIFEFTHSLIGSERVNNQTQKAGAATSKIILERADKNNLLRTQ